MPLIIGELKSGEEIWKGDVPMIVMINRLQETASLGFQYAHGTYMDVDVSFAMAELLVKELGLKRVGKGT